MPKLSSIYEKYEDPKWLNSVRTFRNKAVRESNRQRQLTGIYYWVPRPERKNRYELITFSDQEFGDTSSHVMWSRYVLPMISQMWEVDLQQLRRRLGDCYTALPRGRVIKGEAGFKIIHGGNYCGRGWENKVKRQFNIGRSPCQLIQDQYEVILSDDLLKLQKLLNRELGLDCVSPQESITYESIVERIEEASSLMDSPVRAGKKYRVWTEPKPRDLLMILDRVQDTLGGWVADWGLIVWKRDDADHNTVGKQFGMTRQNTAFYLTPADFDFDEDDDKIVTDIEVETSEFSGRDNLDAVMSDKTILGLMKLIEQRREQLGSVTDDDLNDLMNDLNDGDY